MAKIWIAILCVGLASALKRSRMESDTTSESGSAWPFQKTEKGSTPLPAYYQKTNDMHQDIHELSLACNGLLATNIKDGPSGTMIKVASYISPGVEKPKYRTMIVAGEHAREMIGPEIAMNFIKALCGKARAQDLVVDIEEAKKDTEFIIVVNANPYVRREVEQRDYCKHSNRNNADLNQNFDINFDKVDRSSWETTPGKSPFDQPEANALQFVMNKYKPHAYLDLHSGYRGIFLPNQVSDDPEFGMQLQRLIAPVNEAVCKCPLGFANKEIGYHTAGSALDYSFSVVKIPFALAMEVYIGENNAEEIKDLEARWSTQKTDLLKTSFMENGISSIPMVQTKWKDTSKLSSDECLKRWNPTTELSFNNTVNTWTNALASLSIKSREVKANAATLTAQAPAKRELAAAKEKQAAAKAAAKEEQAAAKAKREADKAAAKEQREAEKAAAKAA